MFLVGQLFCVLGTVVAKRSAESRPFDAPNLGLFLEAGHVEN